MAAVYRVKDALPPVGQPTEVALKLLLPDGAAHEAGQTRFVREFELLRAIDNDRIVRVFEQGEAINNSPFFTMKLAGDKTAKSIIADGAPNADAQRSLPIKHVISLLLEIARALDATHRARVLYLDLKPSNIMLVGGPEDLRVCLIDFGIARKISEDGRTDNPSSRAFIGTSLYMSPEQVRGSALDVRSDIYSLGVVGFEMCTGRPPFERETAFDIAASHLLGKPPGIRNLNKHIPPRLAQVLEVCLSKEPEYRYQSISEVIDRLERIAAKGTAAKRGGLFGLFRSRQ
jgi:serine/threonine-protein kinase